MTQYLTIWDLILTPVYLLVLHYIGLSMRNKRYPVGHPLRKYFMPGLWVKFGGAIFIALIYQFYYATGDTYNFFYHSRIINSALTQDSISVWFDLLLRRPVEENHKLYSYVSQMYWYEDVPSYTVSSIAAVLGLLNGTTYIPIALLFAYFSYTGVWAMFRTFANIYPQFIKTLAIAFLFIPSTFVWGSAVFKDTVCMFGLGWMTYATFRIFINLDFSFRNVFLLIMSFYLIAIIKLYILIAFLPALTLWLLMTYSKRISSAGVRWAINLASIGLIIGLSFLLSTRFAKEMNKYSLEKIAETATVTRTWTAYAAGDEGSTYDIGHIDGTASGMLLKFPAAVIVTLFRPFPWEVKKVIVLLSAIESILFLYFTLSIFLNRYSNPLKFLNDPNLLFCLIFALIFAFSVGISSGNFGALSRYKIPALPFYAAFLAIVHGKKMLVHSARSRM